jgi:hypothetical protein
MNIGTLLWDFVNTPGIGGVIVMVVFCGALGLYYYLTRWILKGGKDEHSHE